MRPVEFAKDYYEAATGETVFSIAPNAKQGTANDIYLINGRAILRLKNTIPTDEGFYDPSEEEVILAEINRQCPHLAPRVLQFDARTGNKVETYVKPRISGDFCGFPLSYEDFCNVIDRMKDLHAIRGSFAPWDLQRRQAVWSERAKQFRDENSDFQADYPDASFLEEEPLCLCHNDLHAGNILIKEDGSATFLDFEFAGMNHPSFDLASLLSENAIAEGDARRLIRRFYGDEYSPEKERRVFVLMEFEDVLWRDWAICRYLDTQDGSFIAIAREKENAAREIKKKTAGR